jgi:hypothetical protein
MTKDEIDQIVEVREEQREFILDRVARLKAADKSLYAPEIAAEWDRDAEDLERRARHLNGIINAYRAKVDA